MLFSFTNALLKVNRIKWSQAAASDALDLVPGTVLATIIALLFNYFYPLGLIKIFYGNDIPSWLSRPLVSTGIVIISACFAFTGFIGVRYRSRLVTGMATRWVAWRGSPVASQERALIIGGGETGQFAAWILTRGKHADMIRVVGYVDDDLYKQGSRIHGLNVLGQRLDIPDLVSSNDIGILVFAIHNISARERNEVIKLCESTPARVVFVPDIPAALNDLVRNGNSHSRPSVEASPRTSRKFQTSPGVLPCHLCLVKVSPLKVDAWLSQLEDLASSGDLDSLLMRLSILRGQLRGDVDAQLDANLASSTGHIPE